MFYIKDFQNYLFYKKYRKKKTINEYGYSLNKFKVLCIEKNITKVNCITNQIVQEFILSLKNKNNTERNQYLQISRLKHYLDFLKESGYIFSSFLEDYHFPKYLRKHHPVISQKELEIILDSIKPKKVSCLKGKVIMEIMYSSALRPGEVANLKISDIYFNRKQLLIRQSKKKKDRLIPIGRYALTLTRDYINTTRKKYLTANSPDNIFLNIYNGKPHTTQGIRFIIRSTLINNGFKPIRPYTLRASAATILLLNGMNIRYISELLGHSDLVTTKIYLQLDDKDLGKVFHKNHPRLSKIFKGV